MSKEKELMDKFCVETKIPAGEHTAIFSLNPLVNLIFHTMNMYDMLGNHGSQYHLRNDVHAKAAIDQKLYPQLAFHEQYFSYRGTFFEYLPMMEAVVSNKLYQIWPTEKILALLTPNNDLQTALILTWSNFYEEYWKAHYERFAKIFADSVEYNPWQVYIEKMFRFTGRTFPTDIFAFGVEATAQSAVTAGKRILVGTLRPKSDFGFRHEGLHLILSEKWADAESIQTFMKAHIFNEVGGWGPSWIKKYEQALVVALDSTMTGIPEERVKSYFVGCNVGDLYPYFWPSISEITESRKSVEAFMLEKLKETLEN